MKSLVALVALLVVKVAAAIAILVWSSAAFAQPGDTEPVIDEPAPVPPPVVEEPAPPPPPPPPPAPAPRFVPTPAPQAEQPQLGGTAEFGMGYGQWRAYHDSISGFAGPSFGFGRFVTSQVALTVRVAGVAITDGGIGWIGVIGPHAQLWVSDQAWVGFGAGAGIGFACGGGGCFDDTTTGVDMRFGFATKPRGESAVNFSIEMTTFEELKTLSLLLGYQSF